jgi:hypothetical protein
LWKASQVFRNLQGLVQPLFLPSPGFRLPPQSLAQLRSFSAAVVPVSIFIHINISFYFAGWRHFSANLQTLPPFARIDQLRPPFPFLPFFGDLINDLVLAFALPFNSFIHFRPLVPFFSSFFPVSSGRVPVACLHLPMP